MFETIVIATDGSARARRAVDVALDIADRFDATVHALHVVDQSAVSASPDHLREQMREALRQRGEKAVAAVGDHTGTPVETAVRVGRPAGEICAYAREVDADMVALGTRGRNGESFLIGRVAEQVVRTCPSPVLTVRQVSHTATVQ